MSASKPTSSGKHSDKHKSSVPNTGSTSGSNMAAPEFIPTGKGGGDYQPSLFANGKGSEKPKLTFGIELEFILVSLQDRPDKDCLDYTYDGESDMVALEIVLNALKEEMKAKCRRCNQDVVFNLKTRSRVGSHSPTIQGQYSVWNVLSETLRPTPEEDSTVPEPERYYTQGVEITSRILSYEEDLVVPEEGVGHDHLISCEQEIKAVLRKLKERFCTFDPKSERWDYLYASRDCALHVHIGQQQAGFETETVRNVLSMNIACERIIDELHSYNRITGGSFGIKPLKGKQAYQDGLRWIDSNANNAPLSFSFLQNTFRRRQSAVRDGLQVDTHYVSPDHYPDRWFDYDPDLRQAAFRYDSDSWLRLINSATTVQALHDLYGSNPRNATINIENLLKNSRKPTIEVRQAASTLEANAILAWVDVAVKMVSYSRTANRVTFEALCGRHGSLRRPEATYVDLCKAIGCKKETLDHYNKRDIGLYGRNLRHAESKMAKEAKNDPFAPLALKSIEDERFRLHLSNAKHRIDEKLIYGAYGQFPRSVVDALVPKGTSEENRERITLGFENPLTVDDFSDSKFSNPESRPGSSGTEGSFSLGTPLTGGLLPTLHVATGQTNTFIQPGHERYGNLDRNRDVSPGPQLGSPLMPAQSQSLSSQSRWRAEAEAERPLSVRGRSSSAQRAPPSQRPSSSQQR